MKHSLTSTMRAFLEAPRFAVLGTTNEDGTPHLTVLWYELQGDEIVFNVAESSYKARNLRRDPRAGTVIEDGYRYVGMYGSVTLVDDQAIALDDVRRLAIRYRGESEGIQLTTNVFSTQQRLTLRLQIERIDRFGFEG